MDDVSLMHMLHTFTDLAHVVDNFSLRHGVALSGDPLKEFASRQTGIHAVH